MDGASSHFLPVVREYGAGMTRISLSNRGKVESHGAPVGIFSPSDLRHRAEEIARIAGRKEATPEDLDQARQELSHANLPPAVSADAEASTTSMSRDPSDPAVERGRQTPEYIDNDEEEAVERLALEGVEEAQHDQMVQARNQEAEADELDDEGPNGDKKSGG